MTNIAAFLKSTSKLREFKSNAMVDFATIAWAISGEFELSSSREERKVSTSASCSTGSSKKTTSNDNRTIRSVAAPKNEVHNAAKTIQLKPNYLIHT